VVEGGIYKLHGPGFSERGPGPDCVAYVHVFFDCVRYIRQCFVVLTALAASGHLAYDAAVLFLYFPLVGPPLLGDPTEFFSLGSQPALGGHEGESNRRFHSRSVRGQ
jgi:hypothetical protein